MKRRFWRAAAADGRTLTLDGRVLRLPSGMLLQAPSAALAEAIAAEWQAAPERFTPAHLPLTRLAGATQDLPITGPAKLLATLGAFARTDLLCYRAPHPAELAAAEAKAWDPWLDWAAARFGARLGVVQGAMALDQPDEALARLDAALAARSAPELAALELAMPILGSCVLGLALAEQAASAEILFETAILDERFQARAWGEDAEAGAGRAGRATALALAARFMELARS